MEKPLNLNQARAIFFRTFDKKKYAITFTLDFEWGVVFGWNSKGYVRTGKYPMVGCAPVLIDKMEGNIHSLRPSGQDESLDEILEKYRQKKGYNHIIKFPPKGNLSMMSDLERVFSLMDTRESFQIEDAIKIVKQKNLFDLDAFKKVIDPDNRYQNILKAIIHGFPISNQYILYNSDIELLPKEITLFKETIEHIYISISRIKKLPDEIKDLYKLKSIVVEASPLEYMPTRLSELNFLEEVRLENTCISSDQLQEFNLPRNCTIKIEGNYPEGLKDAFDEINS
ncbi:MAG: hypothetical protein AAGI07_02575 [Bacteroidota bacterium]